MYLVMSVRLSVRPPARPPVCLSELSWLNRLTFDLGLPSATNGNYPQIWSKGWSLPVQDFCLCVCNQGAYADNLADAVDL